MNGKYFLVGAMLISVAATVAADPLPGTPRRDFRGRTYYYQPIRYYSPVWYAGNGVIATRRQAGVPLWPLGQFNKIY